MNSNRTTYICALAFKSEKHINIDSLKKHLNNIRPVLHLSQH